MAQQTLDPPESPPRRGRGLTFWAGTALIVAGLVVLGYVAWQMYGTTVVSHRKQQSIVAETERLWNRPDPDGKTAGTEKKESLKGAEALVRIPKFGKDYVVPVQEGVTDQVLSEGFGRFPSSVKPGQVGNYAIAAHRVTHGEPLRHMPDLRPGDRVVVETRNKVFTYRLDTDPNKLIVTFKDVWVIDPLPRNPDGGVQPSQEPGQKLITLTTCSELFHTDNRMIAFGHLVKTEPR